MKTSMLKHIMIAFIFGLSTLLSSAQNDVDNYRLYFKFKTVKQTDNSRLLEVSFTSRNKKDRKDKPPIMGADIKFFNILNDDEILLGSVKTNNEGIAKLTLPADQKYAIDEDGYINFKAYFEGSDALDEEEDEIAVKDIFLELNLEEIDSVKTVTLNAYTLDSLKTKVPVKEADVVFSVAGLISRMPIEDGSIEDGTYEFEFPETIPGNKKGIIDVYAYIEDHDDYGNAITNKTINWGTVNKTNTIDNNTLWTDIAPLWMYIVLSILLLGVWANYIYTIFNLIKIKNEGKE